MRPREHVPVHDQSENRCRAPATGSPRRENEADNRAGPRWIRRRSPPLRDSSKPACRPQEQQASSGLAGRRRTELPRRGAKGTPRRSHKILGTTSRWHLLPETAFCGKRCERPAYGSVTAVFGRRPDRTGGTLPSAGHSPITLPRSRPGVRPSSGPVAWLWDEPGDTQSAASPATAATSTHGPAPHFCSPAQWPATANSTASASSPALAGPASPPLRAPRALPAWPSHPCGPGLGNEVRLRRSARTATAVDALMSAPHAVAGPLRSRCPVSPTAAAAPTRVARGPGPCPRQDHAGQGPVGQPPPDGVEG